MVQNFERCQLQCIEKIFFNVTNVFYNFPICRKSISIKRTNSGVRTTFRKKVSAEKLKISSATYRPCATIPKLSTAYMRTPPENVKNRVFPQLQYAVKFF